jgi:peptidoglycan-associated lipoprotein
MSRMRSRTAGGAVALALAAGVVCLAGCAKKRPTTAAEARPPVTSQEPATAVAPPRSAAPVHDVEGDVLSQDLATLNQKGYLSDAFFDYDAAALRDDARGNLAKDSSWLKKYPSVRVLLEGHCDDRGTEAYNLALGERRAQAAREYLVSMGVPEDRIRTVSYGKERPFCQADNESCWQENRRDHFVVTAK